MNMMFAGMIGGWEMVLIFAVVLILFGAKKLPELAKGLGQGIKEFKKASREVTDEFQHASSDVDTSYQPPVVKKQLPPQGTVAGTDSAPSVSQTAPKV